MTDEEPFWRRKALHEMTPAEWESLCDGCARCCLLKAEDEDALGTYYYTDIACRLLDLKTCRCSDYPHRKKRVPDCVVLTPENIAELAWMPRTCAYRVLEEGGELAWWHPLVSGDPETVKWAGISIVDRVFSEAEIHDDEFPDHIVDWVR